MNVGLPLGRCEAAAAGCTSFKVLPIDHDAVRPYPCSPDREAARGVEKGSSAAS